MPNLARKKILQYKKGYISTSTRYESTKTTR